ncbi:putative drug exporter of the RND superfamily [Amycolatopsis arida]|uniref:Putative drug exporter of the RND superfamily n=1 Tax=Amycolatopsis arida TaxID=587909 RepID=A0A1I5ZQR4_9PSEU|nr:MMPL family transporter [Amycolatopsis arida]TDX89294.1 RND superfamily putative drug exporter [Amycolatopsis arida]SFQ58824.1 putative drug exporter of the RND superfamily [Amycolatopsis arida]
MIADEGRRRTRRWLVPALLIVGWLAVGGVGGPFAGKLSGVAENDDAAFLPASAEATEVADLQKRFHDSGAVPAVVVAERSGGITPADQEFLESAADRIVGVPGVAGPVTPPVPAPDGAAAQFVVPVAADVNPGDVVPDVRAALADPPAGLTVLVTGPAGTIADLVEAFAGIDGLLLLVAGAVVALILVLVYRSPVLPVLVLTSAVFALGLASLVVYLLADHDVFALNGQSQGILFILVFGAATDYALLLVSRFREELRDTEDRYRAIRVAWRATLEPIAASAGTVILGLLCLLLSDLNSNRSLGPVAAIGIAAALLASTTFLPATLALTGRGAFWPFRPTLGSAHPEAGGLWGRIARAVGARPRVTWLAATALLLVGVAFVPQLKASGTAQSDVFLTPVDSVAGQEALARHFPAGAGSPTVIVADADRLDAVVAAARDVPGVSQVAPLPGPDGAPAEVDGLAQVEAVLAAPADSPEAMTTVQRLRDAVHAVPGADAKVGGRTAIQYDAQRISERDRAVIIPVVLVVIFAVLALLLRALVAPLLLIATVVLSFGATMGVSALVFNHVFHFPGADPAVPLFAFVFLVALGIDYNIFLMTRVREEATRSGTRAGTLRGLAVTGGVITSAGVVLAATFAALAVLPILFLAQIAFIVAFGVLLDTTVVRSLLVPALTIEVGRTVWWPSRLARGDDQRQCSPYHASRHSTTRAG